MLYKSYFPDIRSRGISKALTVGCGRIGPETGRYLPTTVVPKKFPRYKYLWVMGSLRQSRF